MDDDERDQKVFDLLLSLLDYPAASWDKEQLDSMRTDVECGEYGCPLENLIAMGLDSQEGFDATQTETINTLIALMEMNDSQWVVKLRAWQASRPP
jgi:hypothetical protein